MACDSSQIFKKKKVHRWPAGCQHFSCEHTMLPFCLEMVPAAWVLWCCARGVFLFLCQFVGVCLFSCNTNEPVAGSKLFPVLGRKCRIFHCFSHLPRLTWASRVWIAQTRQFSLELLPDPRPPWSWDCQPLEPLVPSAFDVFQWILNTMHTYFNLKYRCLYFVTRSLYSNVQSVCTMWSWNVQARSGLPVNIRKPAHTCRKM